MYLWTSDFEGGIFPWKPYNFSDKVTAAAVLGTQTNPAKQGKYFMRVQTSTAGGSVALDTAVPNPVVDNQDGTYTTFQVQSLQFSVWLRSADRQRNVQGQLAIWNIRGSNPRSSTTDFDVGGQWTQWSVGLDRPLLQPPPNDPTYSPPPQSGEVIRVEIYLQTTKQDLDVDAAGADLRKPAAGPTFSPVLAVGLARVGVAHCPAAEWLSQ